MVKIYTSQFRYIGPDRFDITVKEKTIFSPTWDIVDRYKNGLINEQTYSEIYKQLMLNSYYNNLNKWNEILNKERIVLVCYCKPNTFCHRYLLVQYLKELGAEYCGEIYN